METTTTQKRERPLNDGSTICLSKGGSFVSSHAVNGMPKSGMALKITSNNGVNVRAVEAALDTLVNLRVSHRSWPMDF